MIGVVRRFGFTMIQSVTIGKVAALSAIVGVAGMLYILRPKPRATAGNLRTLGSAVMQYEIAHKQYPHPSLAGHSWRIRVLPYAVSCPHYENYDFSQTWDSTTNMLLDQRMVREAEWRRPSLGSMPMAFGSSLDFAQQTRFVMIVGDHCVGAESGVRRASDITDGITRTIALVETPRPGIHWLHPIDLQFSEMSFLVNDGPLSIGNANGASPLVSFCDGMVYRVHSEIPPDVLKSFLTIDGNEVYDRDACVQRGWLVPAE